MAYRSFYTLLILLFPLADAGADEIFFDDFIDGDIQNDVPLTRDGDPVRWDPVVPQFPGDYDASSGDFLLTPPAGGATQDFMMALARDITESGISIRAQVRKITDVPLFNEWVGIFARFSPVDPSLTSDQYTGYEARIQQNGLLNIRLINFGQSSDLGSQDVSLDVTQEDVILQFDLFGDKLSTWAWRPGESMPAAPQVSVTNPRFTSGGIGLSSTAVRTVTRSGYSATSVSPTLTSPSPQQPSWRRWLPLPSLGLVGGVLGTLDASASRHAEQPSE